MNIYDMTPIFTILTSLFFTIVLSCFYKMIICSYIIYSQNTRIAMYIYKIKKSQGFIFFFLVIGIQSKLNAKIVNKKIPIEKWFNNVLTSPISENLHSNKKPKKKIPSYLYRQIFFQFLTLFFIFFLAIIKINLKGLLNESSQRHFDHLYQHYH